MDPRSDRDRISTYFGSADVDRYLTNRLGEEWFDLSPSQKKELRAQAREELIDQAIKYQIR